MRPHADSFGDDRASESVKGLWTVLAITVALWAYTAQANVFWLDEWFSINTALRPLAGTIHEALYFELQPPLYFVLLRSWLTLGSTALVARALSLVFALLTVVTLIHAGRDLRISRAWLHLGLVAAITPQIVWAAAQARTYSLTILLTSCTFLLFVRLWVLERPARTGTYALYSLCAYGALMTSYYTGFVLAGQALAAVLFSRRRRQLVATFGALTLAFLPWIPTVAFQVSTHPTSYGDDALVLMGESFPGTVLNFLSWSWCTATQALLWGPLVEHVWLLAGLAIGMGALMILRIRTRAPLTRVEGALAIAAMVPTASLMGLRISGLGYVDVRHWAVVVPGILLVLAILIDRIDPPQFRHVMAGGFLAILFAGLISTERNLNPLDWRSSTHHVLERASVEEAVAVFPSTGLGPVGYYLGDAQPLYGLPAQEPKVSRLAIASEAQLRDRIDQIVDPGQTFWLLRADAGDGGVEGAGHLDRYLEHVTILERQTFPGLTVFHVRVPQPQGGS